MLYPKLLLLDKPSQGLMPLIVRDVFKVMFFVHIDEFQSFSTDAFASLLSEARKFAVHFSLGNQYTE